jgi:hypothetical protein
MSRLRRFLAWLVQHLPQQQEIRAAAYGDVVHGGGGGCGGGGGGGPRIGEI